MSFDDPNREAVGLAPIWTGTETPPEGDDSFDPGAHTVAEVNDYLAANPEDSARVLQVEAAGKNRASLVGSVDD